jgi:thiol-disulfide isomerase/thioredoxin
MAAARRGALHILRRPSGLISLTRGSGMAATVRAVATSSPLPSSSSSSSSPPASSSDSGILLFRGFSASNRTPSWHSSRFFAAEAAQSTGVVAINSSLQYDTLLKEAKDDKKLAVTYFTAKWCGPCRHISPEVDRLSGQYNDVRFLKVDLDEPELQKTVDAAGISAVVYCLCLLTFSVVHVVDVCLACKNLNRAYFICTWISANEGYCCKWGTSLRL